jgi:Calcineurin-like phosphoesterase
MSGWNASMNTRVGWRRAIVALAGAGALATGALDQNAQAAEAPVSFGGVERVVAFADVHGAYEELTTLLQSVGVVDTQLHWSAGKTHLVSLGDLLDRGADSRKVMDLLMRLQGEARAAGGQLHIVLGNHEAMNVLGDLRYVAPGEYAAYSAEEDAAERAKHREEFLARQTGATAADFDRLFPPGYFGQRRLLGPDGTYGRWLLGLPAAIKINDTVYMHGGPSSLMGGRTIEQLDRDYAAAMASYLAAEAELDDGGLLHFEDRYDQRATLARQRLEAMPAGPARDSLASAVERFQRADDDPMLGPTGPNWYRGAAFCNECSETDVLKPFLAANAAKRVIIGHTVARNGTVVSRFDGAVIKLDAGMNRAVYKGHPAALIIDATGTRVTYVLPPVAPAGVPPEPLYLSSQTIDEDTVADILARGTIETVLTCAPGVMTARVTLEGRSVDAVFEAASREAVQHELAAYRLDRLLGLGLVPATVARSYEGKDGVLQGRPANWASEQDRTNARNGSAAGLACQTITAAPQATPARRPAPTDGRAKLPTGGWCDMRALYQLAYAFDALIGNQGRSLDRYLYDADAGTLFLTGHDAAFGTDTKLQKALEPELAKTGPEMLARLRRLDAESVEGAIGELAGSKAVRPLLERRDRILEIAGR